MKKKTFVLPFAYFSGCFFAASAGYAVVGWLTRLILGRSIVFGVVTGGHPVPLYHYIHPFQYIAAVAFAYAWVASAWTLLPRHASNRWLRKIEILIVLVVSVVASLLRGRRPACSSRCTTCWRGSSRPTGMRSSRRIWGARSPLRSPFSPVRCCSASRGCLSVPS